MSLLGRIILVLLVVSNLLFGDIVVGKEYRVNDRLFTYYCLDGVLFLESRRFKYIDNEIFTQVYIQSTNDRSIPRECYVENGMIKFK